VIACGEPIMIKFHSNAASGIIFLTVFAAIACGEQSAVITRSQIEADWLRQDQIRFAPPISSRVKVLPQQDAIGAIDGVINGKWGTG